MSVTTALTTELTGAMFIAGERRTGTAGTTTARNPRTGQDLAPVVGLGTRADVDDAATAAAAAFDTFRSAPREVRATLLAGTADNLEELADVLVPRVVAETGIPLARVQGELARTVGQLRMFAELVRSGRRADLRVEPALPERTPTPRPDLRQRRVPVGPVAVFGASNFPLAFSVAGGDTASALAAGCPVVVKAHSSHPGTSELVGAAVTAAVAQAGLPAGVFSLLFGSGREVGTALVAHPAVRAVGFTGSRSGGTALVEVAAARAVPIPVYAEMSSVNPVVLLPGALAARAEKIAEGFVVSCTTSGGQLCTNPGLVVAVGPDAGRFVEAAGRGVAATPAVPLLSGGIRAAYDEGVAALRGHPDVQEVASGLPAADIAEPGAAHLFTTTLEPFVADPALREEVFGATALVVTVASAADVPRALEVLGGQLTATVHAEPSDHPQVRELLPRLERLAGRVVLNGWPTGVDVGDAVVHGGPYPATSDGRSTSVGTAAVERFLRPVAYQDVPLDLLPEDLRQPTR